MVTRTTYTEDAVRAGTLDIDVALDFSRMPAETYRTFLKARHGGGLFEIEAEPAAARPRVPQVAEVFPRPRPEVVLDAAAYTDVRFMEAHPGEAEACIQAEALSRACTGCYLGMRVWKRPLQGAVREESHRRAGVRARAMIASSNVL